ncbi:MAG: substrate-binding domain-containing protein [Anaerolineae bacterium]|nr:substrate-binding domain-containing protein [Anaerolineae bacterium]
MKKNRYSGIFAFLLMVGLTTLACGFGNGADDATPEPPRNAEVVQMVANTSLGPWLDTAVTQFNASETQTSEGKPVFVQLTAADAGQAISDISAGAETSLWIPDDMVWVNILADQGNNSFQGDCTSVAQSPLVIGMWREVAEALGWPGLPLGWLDIGSLASDTALWNYYSGGELGNAFRLGHTHPGLSGSGAGTLLALVQAAQSKTEAVTETDLQQPIVQASVGAFEGGVTWFSPNTRALSTAMSSRGLNYLSGGVMYESDVVNSGNGQLVAVYPFEGTFMATHPACINGAATAVQQEATRLFRDYLLSETGQQLAVAGGLRPVNTAVSLASPLDEAHGVDPSQPEVVFNAPSVAAVYAAQELWQAARKDVNLALLLDTSGSMRGGKMESMRTAAIQFVEQMGDDDYLSIISFNTEPYLIINHAQVGPNRQKIISAIEDLRAEGDTTLFDAIGDGAVVLQSTTQPETTNALVVLSDGQDTRSYRYDASSASDMALANNLTVFTIAYGSDADDNTLRTLASQSNGNFFEGDEASIAAIYEEMSAAFGGSVGVGR